MSTDLELIRAGVEHQSALANLLELYIHEFSELVPIDVGDDGTELSGDGEAWDMAEFFLLRRYRRRGIGTQLAEKVWLHCPGRWQIRVMDKNILARKVWEASLTKFTGPPV